MELSLEQFRNFVKELESNVEWLETTHHDSVECISVENMEGVLEKYFPEFSKVLQDEYESQ